MRILLDCRPLQSIGASADRSHLILSAALALSEAEGVEWVALFDRRYRQGQFPVLPGEVVVRRALPGSVGWRYWYDRLIPRLAKQKKVDRVWLTGGVSGGSVRAGGRAGARGASGASGAHGTSGEGSVGSAACRGGPSICVWMPERLDPSLAEVPGYGALYRRRLKSGFGNAATIVCYSERDRTWLADYRSEGKDKIKVIRPVPDETIQPMPAEEKERVKTQWTQGMEYFLADVTGCSEKALVDLLKGFSLFKKRQLSGMRLVLTGETGFRNLIMERLASYKYRQDVDWPAEGDRGDLTGAAYAVVMLLEGNSLGSTLLNRWKAAVPVIAASGGLWEEMAEGAVLGFAPGDPASMAAQLMRIYKEEDLRAELIGKGFERLKIDSRENFLQLLRVITEIAAC